MRGRGSGQSDEFIREVDEAVRQDRWLKLWKQYGSLYDGGRLALVIGIAAGVGWRAWQENQRQDEAERYMAAISFCARTSRRGARRLQRSPRMRTAAMPCSPACRRRRPGRGQATAQAATALGAARRRRRG